MVNMTKLTYESLQQALDAYKSEQAGAQPNPTRARILKAASKLFIRQGYRKTSVDEIARAAQVAKGTIYSYFPGKTDLMIQAIVVEKQKYMQRLEPVLRPGQSGREMLHKWIVLAVKGVHEMPLVSRLISGDGELLAFYDAMAPQLREQMVAMQREMLTELIERAVAVGQFSPAQISARAQVLYGLFHSLGLMSSAPLRGSLDLEQYAEVLADIVVDGLAPCQNVE